MSVKKILISAALAFSFYACNDNSDNPVTCNSDSCGHCPGDQTGIKICSFVADPTASESITLINYTSSDQDLTNWTLWDQNAVNTNNNEENLTGTLTANRGTLTFSSLDFTINNSGETLYLKNDSNQTVDTATN